MPPASEKSAYAIGLHTGSTANLAVTKGEGALQ